MISTAVAQNPRLMAAGILVAYRPRLPEKSMDKKSEEELERIANLVTAEMIRSLNTPKPKDAPEEDAADREDEADEP